MKDNRLGYYVCPIAIFYSYFYVRSKLSLCFVATAARNGIGAGGLGVMRMENVPLLKD